MTNDNFWINMETYIPKIYWEDLMYMGETDGISLYKHYDTRNYINVDYNGHFYKYHNDKYIRIDKDTAIYNLSH
ncbi:hypothetical protein [Clostridium botulinum]|uniref:hypothetical protein n=1 Tax=Clostridium botulinum TaxID=1491 RepID=UPI001C9AEA21|nr:hypothetical protein [Clostridium botulinum]MBY6838803.1 hypothetical protein [Clostridium botulinum]